MKYIFDIFENSKTKDTNKRNNNKHTLGVRSDHKTCHMAHQTRHMVTFG